MKKILILLLGAVIIIGGYGFVKLQKMRQAQQVMQGAVRQFPKNTEWGDETLVDIVGYDGHVMELGISHDGKFLLFNDRNKPNKDMHWATKIDDVTYQYQGRVENTVSDTVDGTPSLSRDGTLYYTTLKERNAVTMYKAEFVDGVAENPVPLEGDIFPTIPPSTHGRWIVLDPDVSDDERFLYYSEGLFGGGAMPSIFNVRGAIKSGRSYRKLPDEYLKNINTSNLEYAPAISNDGLTMFFTKANKDPGAPLGIFVAKRSALDRPFRTPERISAITGAVEAPVLSGDEKTLYYHRMHEGKFRAYKVTKN